MARANKTLQNSSPRAAETNGSATPTGGRTAEVSRDTKETQLRVAVNLDGQSQCTCTIPVPFFCHMMDLFARHSLIDLEITGNGDVEIDAHHTVEDVGIVLGQAVKSAPGDRAGIERYGEAYVPMEET